MIELDDIQKNRRLSGRENVELDGVDLHVEAGEICGVIGESVSALRTLVRCVNLLDRPDGGSVVVAGQDLTAASRSALRSARHGIGMLTGDAGLLDQRTIARNVGLPLEFAGVRQRKRDLFVDEMLDLVGLAEYAGAYPAELGVLDRSRARIARALVAGPRVMLCHEPTRDLDPATGSHVLDLVRNLARRFGVTVLLATQHHVVVKAVCDSVALLRDGRVAEHAMVTDVLRRPDSDLAGALLPTLPDPVTGADRDRLLADLTFTGDAEHEIALTETARACGIDVSVVAGGVETICGLSVGRLRVELIGPGEDCQRALLRFADLHLTPKVHI
ncbi:ATP-binding cassette domain-containing protein [Actinopolymorpha sp. B17G11]|uniref:methionine ABC transporter ATP-binding protein n=1 Tax=unclassified Actinopolymorpha TaxID=2627063 RepID=UPI0032D93CB6